MGDLAQVTSFWVRGVRGDKKRVRCARCNRSFAVSERRIIGWMGEANVAVQPPKGWAMNIKTGEVTCSEKCRD